MNVQINIQDDLHFKKRPADERGKADFGWLKSAHSCSIPDDHIDPRRLAFFMARSVLEDIRKEKRDARSTA